VWIMVVVEDDEGAVDIVYRIMVQQKS